MRAAEARHVQDEVRAEVMAEIESALAEVPATALIPLLTFIGECRDRRQTTTLQVRRALMRWQALRRFAALKFRTGMSDRRVIAHMVRESARDESGAKLKSRTVQTWVKAWNTVGAEGLAAGPTSLVDNYNRNGRPKKHHDSNGV